MAKKFAVVTKYVVRNINSYSEVKTFHDEQSARDFAQLLEDTYENAFEAGVKQGDKDARKQFAGNTTMEDVNF